MSGISSILLVSKDSHMIEAIQSTLSGYKEVQCELEVIYPIENAFELIDKADFALLLIDVTVGDKCVEAIEKLCSFDPLLPLIVLTYPGFKNAELVLKLGAQQVISKSTIPDDLLAQKIFSSIHRKRIENELVMKDQILQAVNYAAEIFLSQSNWESWIVEVLARLGQASQSDRVFILRNSKNSNNELTSNLHAEWVGKGVQPNSAFYEMFNPGNKNSKYLRWVNLFENGKIIHGKVDGLPQTEQTLLKEMGVKSLINIPIFTDHSWWGIIGFDQCEHQKIWSTVEIEALKTAANIFGAAISRQEAEKKLTYLATHDFLTGLPNRMLFEDRFDQSVARAERIGEKIAIISIDLDKFKTVNDTNGHPVGDKVLTETGKRFCSALRGSDTCARIGGDEFAVIAEGIRNKADVMRVMEKLTTELQDPIEIDNKEIRISASMGAALYPDISRDLEGLLNAADKALYQVKEKHSLFKIFKDEQYTLLKG
jgi:diguanylate cyclase (GGDEF)-like protein